MVPGRGDGALGRGVLVSGPDEKCLARLGELRMPLCPPPPLHPLFRSCPQARGLGWGTPTAPGGWRGPAGRDGASLEQRGVGPPRALRVVVWTRP